METFKFVMDVNFFGYVAMVKSLAPLLRKGYGRVINIASVAGFLPATGMAAYSASKHAVEAFTDCLRMEMAPFGVAVTCIEPFFMKTNIIQGIDVQLSKLYDSLPQNEKDVWGDHLAKKLGATSALINAIAGEPGEVVDCIVHALQSSVRFLFLPKTKKKKKKKESSNRKFTVAQDSLYPCSLCAQAHSVRADVPPRFHLVHDLSRQSRPGVPVAQGGRQAKVQLKKKKRGRDVFFCIAFSFAFQCVFIFSNKSFQRAAGGHRHRLVRLRGTTNAEPCHVAFS